MSHLSRELKAQNINLFINRKCLSGHDSNLGLIPVSKVQPRFKPEQISTLPLHRLTIETGRQMS